VWHLERKYSIKLRISLERGVNYEESGQVGGSIIISVTGLFEVKESKVFDQSQCVNCIHTLYPEPPLLNIIAFSSKNIS
jgi:hypothetical protein